MILPGNTVRVDAVFPTAPTAVVFTVADHTGAKTTYTYGTSSEVTSASSTEYRLTFVLPLTAKPDWWVGVVGTAGGEDDEDVRLETKVGVARGRVL